MAAPMELMGRTGVRKMIMDDTITNILFIVLPTLNVNGDI